MSKINKALLVLVILVLLLGIWIIRPKNRKIITLSSQEKEEGSVTIGVIPEMVAVGKKPSFKLEFNTHSVDLDFDVTKSVYLVNDSGVIYKNSLWDGASAGGHHRSGILTFQTLLPKTKYIELVFININGVSERKFHWEL